MKKPCHNCPFRSDRIFTISQERRAEIATGLWADSDFPCHKTFEEVEDYQQSPHKSKRCTGAAIFLENARPGGLRSNLAFRMAIMCHEFKISQLEVNAPVFKTPEEFINAFDE